jgi:HEAT repeat protein
MNERAVAAIPYLINLLDDNAEVGWKTIELEDMKYPVRETVASQASDAIYHIGKESVAPCIDALKAYVGSARGDELIGILGRFKDSRTIGPLTALLKHRDPKIRNKTVQALVFWEDPNLVPPLINTLKDEDAGVRREATWVLQNLHDERTVPPLIEALKDGTPDIRRGAAKALGEQGDSRAVAALLDVLNDPTEKIQARYASACALGQIADSRGLQALQNMMENTSMPKEIRASAIAGLALSKNPHFSKPLIALVTNIDEVADLRGDAIEGITNLDGLKSLSLLIDIAKTTTENEYVRCCSAICIINLTNGEIDDMQILPALKGRFISHQEGQDERMNALQKVVAHGKTAVVREAAKDLLEKW